LRRSAQGATYIRQGDHHVGHRPTFWLKLLSIWQSYEESVVCVKRCVRRGTVLLKMKNSLEI